MMRDYLLKKNCTCEIFAERFAHALQRIVVSKNQK